jgi:hypothetical protein
MGASRDMALRIAEEMEERRMDYIGQNGNEGLHYEAERPYIDLTVEAVRCDLKQRSEVGIKKYGVTLDRKDLKLKDWLQHAYEETLDKALYLKRAIKEIEGN